LIAIGSTRGDPTNVDVPAATAAGIPVLRAPGRNADAVAEIAVALLFSVTRHVVPADRDVRAGDVWRGGTIPYQRYRAWQVAGQTVGLVGLGAVGRALRWRLEGLGMKVMADAPYAEDAKQSLDDVGVAPHIGGGTYGTETNLSRLVADDLARLLTGERPVHIVNPEVLK